MKNYYVLVFLVFLFTGCQEEKATSILLNVKDKEKIEANIRKILTLNLHDSVSDFELISNDGDSLYTGIDWVEFDKHVKALSKDSLFTNSFIEDYKSIAFTIDQQIKNKEVSHILSDINPYFEKSIWCDCNDFTNWKSRLIISDMRIMEQQVLVNISIGENSEVEIKFDKRQNDWLCASWSTIKLP